jgi:type IV secretion system protein VirB1
MIDHGKPSTREEQARRLAESMKRQLGAFCPLLLERDVVELMLNAGGRVWIDRLAQSMMPVCKIAVATVESFIATVASTLCGAVTCENPIIECELPDEPSFGGSRFDALIPSVVSSPIFTIRRKAFAVFTLGEYERHRIMTVSQRAAIETAAVQRVAKSKAPRRAVVAGKHMMVRLFEQRCALLLAAGAAWAACGVPGAAGAARLSTADFGALSVRCAPAVPVATLEGVAKTESGLDSWALRDNTTKVSETPPTLQAALSDAWQWIRRGDSVDLGLMQINSANLAALGMTARGALDPCASLAGGAAVLWAAYGGGKTSAEQQVALLMALSRYNTGSPFKGILNGYARRVIVNANAGTTEPSASAPQTIAQADPNAPPSWNVWAMATYARAHGAPWLIPLAPASRTPAQAQKSPAGRPAPAAPAATVVATVQATSSTQQPQRTP